jgi:hypothetical protein
MVVIIGLSGCISFNKSVNNTSSIKNYTIYGVSFNYPGSWHVSIPPHSERTVVIGSNDPIFSKAELQIQLKSNNGLSEQNNY